MIRRSPIILAALMMVTLPSSAEAARYLNPPGESGFNQYTELVPSATGNMPTEGPGGLGGARSTLPAAVRSALKGSGKRVKALSRFVAATAPPRSAGRGQLSATGSSESPLNSLAAGVLGGGGGMYAGLPMLMGVAALLALAFLVWRRRGRS